MEIIITSIKQVKKWQCNRCIFITWVDDFVNYIKIQSTFSTVVLTHTISRIIVKSELRMNFSVKMNVTIATAHPHGTNLKIIPKFITKNCHLSKYLYKIILNYNCCDFNDYCGTHFNSCQHSKIAQELKVSKFCMYSIPRQQVAPAIVYILVVGYMPMTHGARTVYCSQWKSQRAALKPGPSIQ